MPVAMLIYGVVPLHLRGIFGLAQYSMVHLWRDVQCNAFVLNRMRAEADEAGIPPEDMIPVVPMQGEQLLRALWAVCSLPIDEEDEEELVRDAKRYGHARLARGFDLDDGVGAGDAATGGDKRANEDEDADEIRDVGTRERRLREDAAVRHALQLDARPRAYFRPERSADPLMGFGMESESELDEEDGRNHPALTLEELNG